MPNGSNAEACDAGRVACEDEMIMTVEQIINAVFDQAAAAASDLAALAVALKAKNYDAADTWLEAARDKLAEIDDSLSVLVHHHRRGKI
jgi:hypothetical protein